MRKNIKYIIIIFIVAIAYGAFLMITNFGSSTGSAPTIKVPEGTLKVSVKAKDKDLLKGIKASDDEDGDLTSSVFIESISTFDNDQVRTITYGVYDSDDNLTRATRKIKYKDYTKPEITITKALCFNYLSSTDSLKDYVEATSSVDGDISANISITQADYSGKDFDVTYSVSDSCGVNTTLTTKASIISSANNIEIELSDYMIRVEPGTIIYPRTYIDSVKILDVEDASLIYNVKISDNYDSSTPGTYEFIYRLDENDESGITKLVVIVEEDADESE